MCSLAILWYRRDLRLHDHPALSTAVHEYERVVPAFIFDDALLHGRYASAPRTQFMLGCLTELQQRLEELGSGLIVRHGQPEWVLGTLASELAAQAVLWTSDVSPFARERDRRVSEALRQAGVQARPQGGNYVIDVSRPRTARDEPYRVFSPFQRAWQQLPRRERLAAPDALAPLPADLSPGRLPALEELDLRVPDGAPEPVVPPGEVSGRAAFAAWLDRSVDHYASAQNGMSRRGTSMLSPYLRWGCLSALEVERACVERGGAGAGAWVRQLCWRDFYAHVLLMWPGNVHHEFQERFRELEWDDPAAHLDAWQRGETGYPIVDAGMRQLAYTGWMHNRARLIVGAFLTKDLHLDWREGERWFGRLLLDGEPAQNNGNWQWIASVGVDPAPTYRRMYNPTLQGQRFDPQGEYVRRWVPELTGVPGDKLLEPWRMSGAEQRQAACQIGRDYPAPIVDHKQERARALERYREVAPRDELQRSLPATLSRSQRSELGDSLFPPEPSGRPASSHPGSG